MGEKENREFIVKRQIIKAEDTKETTEILIEKEKYPDAVSRAYYASFHYLSALLASIGEFPKTHKRVIHLIYQYFVEDGDIPSSLHKEVSKLLNLRGDADYGILNYHTKEEADIAMNTMYEVEKTVLQILNY